jgi:hypothetical protein
MSCGSRRVRSGGGRAQELMMGAYSTRPLATRGRRTTFAMEQSGQLRGFIWDCSHSRTEINEKTLDYSRPLPRTGRCDERTGGMPDGRGGWSGRRALGRTSCPPGRGSRLRHWPSSHGQGEAGERPGQSKQRTLSYNKYSARPPARFRAAGRSAAFRNKLARRLSRDGGMRASRRATARQKTFSIPHPPLRASPPQVTPCLAPIRHNQELASMIARTALAVA